MKLDTNRSVAMPEEVWELLDRVSEQVGSSRNELVRRYIHHGLICQLMAGLYPPNVDRMLKEARGPLLIPDRIRSLINKS
jgi:ribbon-helix-helix CopG family protein